MKSIKELTIERLKTKDKVLKTALGSLIASVKAIGKAEARETTEADIELVAKDTINKLTKQLGIVTGDVLEAYSAEISILKDLLGIKEITEDELIDFITEKIQEVGREIEEIDGSKRYEITNRDIGGIMKSLTAEFGDEIDKKLAGSLIRKHI